MSSNGSKCVSIGSIRNKWIPITPMDPHGRPASAGTVSHTHTHTQVYAAWHNQHFLIRRNVVFVSVCVRLKSSRRCLVGLEMVVLRSHIALPISICIF
jgi:hypothetical protein